MSKRRVLLVHLDGYDPQLAERLARDGHMPALTRLAAESARFSLEHGAAMRTGLAGEHISTGLSPVDAGRWAAVDFDAEHYGIAQRPTLIPPFCARLGCRTVVFDQPYFDLSQAPRARGLVAWGAHDPGVRSASRPEGLDAELAAKVGPYPAAKWIYGFTWPSPQSTAEMGAALARGVDARAEAALWLLGERLPDWELALVCVSETHSASEALWHGMDEGHPLHALPSSAPARQGLLAVYSAVDRLVGRLAERFADSTLLVFSLHGMGRNASDVASMLLLPELLYRAAGRGVRFRGHAEWRTGALPLLGEAEGWQSVLRDIPAPKPASNLDWMPAARYRDAWPDMNAFALPSFYDGRVRLNIAGRERQGRLPPEAYEATCAQVETMLRDCRDIEDGESVVKSIERGARHAHEVGPSAADLVVEWRRGSIGFVHPRAGRIGPAPWRRAGGHTEDPGIALLRAPGMDPGDRGRRSAFDVVPTAIELLGERRPASLSGRSMLT